MKVVICGGGIVGCSTAYYLTLRGVDVTIIEQTGIACASSGKAGGFLAKDWCDTYAMGTLAQKGFTLHGTLAREFPSTDYRCIETLAVSSRPGCVTSNVEKTTDDNIPAWLDKKNVKSVKVMGTTDSTAQVNPMKLTQALCDAAVDRGAKIEIGQVTGVQFTDDKSKVIGVLIDGKGLMKCDTLVIAMGPWSATASKWFKRFPGVTSRRAHSILLKLDKPVTPHALFVDYRPRNGTNRSPEIYPRSDGEVYVCGMSDSVSLPEKQPHVKPSDESCDILKQISAAISTQLSEAPVINRSACYLPVSPDGLPLVGKIPSVEGAYVGTGHSCWGILCGPVTGQLLAELIFDGTCSIDITPFEPKRFY